VRLPSLPRRAVLGAVLSASLIGGGLAVAFAADPTLGCSFKDPAGDSSLPGQDGSGDKDLDLVTVGYTTNATSLLVSAKVAALTESGPDLFPGDDFEFDFTVNKKVFQVGTTRVGDPTGLAGSQISPYVMVDGTDVTPASAKSTYDTKTSVVEVSVATADLDKLAGAPMSGATLSALGAISYAYTGGPERQADAAKPTGTVTWTYGASSCSGAAPAPSGSASPAPSGSPSSDTATATITIAAPARIQTSDPEPVTATLKDGSGQPMAGKRITAQVGAGKAVAGTTNSAGQVKLRPVVIDKAGTRALVVRYAGAAGGSGKAESRKAITVLAEVARLATKSSGTGSTRTFTITLTDDDAVRHPYANAKVTVSYSGRSVTVTTNSSGQASLKIRVGTHVDLRYAGRAGYVQAATARTVV
jgi:hypothetical protein